MSDANNENESNDMDATPPETMSSGPIGEKRKREVKLRSRVWQHFTKLEIKGKGREECRCNYCKNVFSCPSNGGTTHLIRHIENGLCSLYQKGEDDKKQMRLTFTTKSSGQGTTVIPWKFDQERSRSDLTEMIINQELPFNFVEYLSFRKYIRGICPNYKFVSRNTMKSDCMKRYEVEKKTLKEILQNTSGRICLTTDTWTSCQDLPYMALTAHFIDSGWKLHKRIINFVMIPVKASGENLADIIISCLQEWNIDKICTITMDNCTTNDVVARNLAEHYSSRGLLLLNGRAIQVRCWGHVLNLIVQEGLDSIKDTIRRVRNAVKYVKASPKRKVEFLQYAEQERISRSKMLVLDVCTRWNSTYKMLNSALHYKRAYDRLRSRDFNFKDAPTSDDWKMAEIIHVFLEAFFVATKTFSGSKYCTSNIFFREVYRILILLRDTSKDPHSLLGNMALNMLGKFEKYWVDKEPNILLSIAAVLDPRFKLKYLKFCYNKIYDSHLVLEMMSRVEIEVRTLFNEYVVSFEASHMEGSLDTSNMDKADVAVGNTSMKKNFDFMEEFYKFSEEEDVLQSKSELDIYLEEKLHPSKSSGEDDFDVLQWWKINSSKFQVLSAMVSDVLTIPVSSVASECAFSTGGRVLNKFRSSLLPSTAEALICTQDWIRGEAVQTEYDEEADEAFNCNFSSH